MKFARHILVGGTATIIEWMLFYALAISIGIHYQAAVVIAISISSIFNYALSKTFTFKCKSKKIIPQFSIFAIIVIIYLIISLILMTIFVEYLSIQKMTSKIITTIIMLIVNYNLHKYITFNKKLFKQ